MYAWIRSCNLKQEVQFWMERLGFCIPAMVVFSWPTAIRARMLQCVGLNPMSNDVCEDAYSQRVTEFVLCAGHQKGSKDTCMASSPNP